MTTRRLYDVNVTITNFNLENIIPGDIPDYKVERSNLWMQSSIESLSEKEVSEHVKEWKFDLPIEEDLISSIKIKIKNLSELFKNYLNNENDLDFRFIPYFKFIDYNQGGLNDSYDTFPMWEKLAIELGYDKKTPYNYNAKCKKKCIEFFLKN
nr:9080_t:CDS:2 [Entrophospora candida]